MVRRGAWVPAIALLAGILVSGVAPGAHSVVAPGHLRAGAPGIPVLGLGPGSMGWINVTAPFSGGPPPGRAYGSLAYDVADREWVEFGGCTATCDSNATWVLAQGHWLNITNGSGAPPPRGGAGMDYDPQVGGVLLFGGFRTDSTTLNDTWLFKGGQWTNVSYVGPAPSPRADVQMAFDPAPDANGTVLFGGCEDIRLDTCSNDTWIWQLGTGWVPQDIAPAPGPRGYGAMAFDPVDGRLLLFGGQSYVECGTGHCDYNDTWEYYSGAWWSIFTGTNAPSARDSPTMAYDEALDGFLLFGGGVTGLSAFNDTWLFASGHWAALSGSSAPSPRWGASMAEESGLGEPLLFSGQTAMGSPGDTWLFGSLPHVSVALANGLTRGEAGAPLAFQVGATGGSGPYDLTVDFGDGAGTELAGAGPWFNVTHRYGLPGAITVTVEGSDAMGLPASSSTAVTIDPGPRAGASSDRAEVDVGTSVTFRGTLNGTNGTPTFSWSFGDGGTANGSAPVHAFQAAGSFVVNLTATAADQAVSTAQLTELVQPAPSVTLGAAPGAPVAGGGVGFWANITGGTAPYSVTWSFGDGSRGTLPSPVHVFAAPGTYPVQVWVNDSGGGGTHATLTVTVGGGPGTGASSPGAGIPLWYWGALAAIAIATVAGAYWLRRRR